MPFHSTGATPATHPRTGVRLCQRTVDLPSAAANRHIVHHDVAGTARLHHGAHAVAAGLNHVAAGLIAAGAQDAAAVAGHLTLAHAIVR